MESNNKFLIKVPFTSGKKYNGFSYYFIVDGIVIDKKMSWDVDKIDFDKTFNESWIATGYYKTAIKGGYVRSEFAESPMKFIYNGDNLVFNTIFNSPSQDDCLHGKYKLKKIKKNVRSADGFIEINLIDFIKMNNDFKKLFYLYNKTIISSPNTMSLFDQSDEQFFKKSIKEIKEVCNNDPTKPKGS